MKKSIPLNVLYIFIGSLLYAISVNSFTLSNNLGEGGVTGISLILFYVSGFPTGLTIFLINVVILTIGYKYLDKEEFRKYFLSIDEVKLIQDKKRWIQLCHYPLILWYKKNKGAYHIFGHMHNEQITKEYNILKDEENALNACVEINNFEPCELEELIQNNIEFRIGDSSNKNRFMF